MDYVSRASFCGFCNLRSKRRQADIELLDAGVAAILKNGFRGDLNQGLTLLFNITGF